MINLRIEIRADQADELADAFAFITDRGFNLRPVKNEPRLTPVEGDQVVELAARRSSKQQAAARHARTGGPS